MLRPPSPVHQGRTGISRSAPFQGRLLEPAGPSYLASPDPVWGPAREAQLVQGPRGELSVLSPRGQPDAERAVLTPAAARPGPSPGAHTALRVSLDRSPGSPYHIPPQPRRRQKPVADKRSGRLRRASPCLSPAHPPRPCRIAPVLARDPFPHCLLHWGASLSLSLTSGVSSRLSWGPPTPDCHFLRTRLNFILGLAGTFPVSELVALWARGTIVPKR